MKLYARVPQDLVDSWEQSSQTLPSNQTVGFHYHDVDEWLTVVQGGITFFTLADELFHVEIGRALHIPRGEVHRAEADADAVECRMFLAGAIPTFVNELTALEVNALQDNLEFPDYEDGRIENGEKFFVNALSDQLVFCRASGVCVGKRQFIDEAFVDKGRFSARTLQILNKTEQGLLISTVVNASGADGEINSFTNVRFLAVEDGALRCRLWVNYPQLERVAVGSKEDKEAVMARTRGTSLSRASAGEASAAARGAGARTPLIDSVDVALAYVPRADAAAAVDEVVKDDAKMRAAFAKNYRDRSSEVRGEYGRASAG